MGRVAVAREVGLLGADGAVGVGAGVAEGAGALAVDDGGQVVERVGGAGVVRGGSEGDGVAAGDGLEVDGADAAEVVLVLLERTEDLVGHRAAVTAGDQDGEAERVAGGEAAGDAEGGEGDAELEARGHLVGGGRAAGTGHVVLQRGDDLLVLSPDHGPVEAGIQLAVQHGLGRGGHGRAGTNQQGGNPPEARGGTLHATCSLLKTLLLTPIPTDGPGPNPERPERQPRPPFSGRAPINVSQNRPKSPFFRASARKITRFSYAAARRLRENPALSRKPACGPNWRGDPDGLAAPASRNGRTPGSRSGPCRVVGPA